MKKPFYSLSFVGLLTAVALLSLVACSGAQTRTMTPDVAVTSTKYNDAQEEQGAVQKFLLTSRGDIDGLLLDGGIQVSFPAQLTAQLKKIVAVNDVVLVKGFYENDRVFKAEKITNVNTSKSVTQLLSPPPAPLQEDFPNMLPPEGTHSSITKTAGPSHRGMKALSASGNVQNRLYGKFGELNGVVLSDGTIVRLRPDVINTMNINAEIGDRLKASGFGTQNANGRVIEATEVIRQ